jgi:hypothetical protein
MNAIPNRRRLLLGALAAGAGATLAAVPAMAAAVSDRTRSSQRRGRSLKPRAPRSTSDGHMDYLPTLMRSSILRSPLLVG